MKVDAVDVVRTADLTEAAMTPVVVDDHDHHPEATSSTAPVERSRTIPLLQSGLKRSTPVRVASPRTFREVGAAIAAETRAPLAEERALAAETRAAAAEAHPPPIHSSTRAQTGHGRTRSPS